MNGGDGGSDRPQGFARRTASSAPRSVAFGPQPVRRFTGPAHLRLCPHWLRLPPTAPTVATKKQAQGLFFYVVRSACVITWRWKSATGLAVGTVSQGQGRPSWGGVWRKPKAKPRSDEQKLYRRRAWNGRVSDTKRSPILPEFQGVNTADIWGEGDYAYPRRSCRQVEKKLVVTTNGKKSAEVIVPSEKNLGRAEQS